MAGRNRQPGARDQNIIAAIEGIVDGVGALMREHLLLFRRELEVELGQKREEFSQMALFAAVAAFLALLGYLLLLSTLVLVGALVQGALGALIACGSLCTLHLAGAGFCAWRIKSIKDTQQPLRLSTTQLQLEHSRDFARALPEAVNPIEAPKQLPKPEGERA